MLLFLAAGPLGCTSVDEPEDPAPIGVIEAPAEVTTETEIVPPPEVIEGEDYFSGLVDPFRHNWYVKHLKAMGEGPLLDADLEGSLKFRFLWLRTFHEPYMVRGFMDEDNKFKLHMRGLDGSGGYQPGKKVHDTFSNLTTGQSQEVLAMLSDLNICSTEADPWGGADGAQWVFEIVENGTYCLVDFWSPKEGSKYREFGLYLLKTSRVKTWEIDVY